MLYAYFSYAALGLAYSLVNIPYGSLASVMTESPAGRVRLSVARTIGRLIVGLSLSIVITPRLEVGADLQHIFRVMMIVCFIVGSAMYIWTFLSAKEVVPREHATINLREGFRTVSKNKPLLLLSLASTIFLTAQFVQQTLQICYLRDALDVLYLAAVPVIITARATLVLAAVMPRIVKKVGKLPVYLTGTALLATSGLGIFFTPTNMP